MRISAAILLFSTVAGAQYVPMAFNAGGAAAAPAYVQSATTGTAGEATTVTLAGIVAPHALYATQYNGGGSGQALTFSDSQGNAWTTIASANLVGDGDTIALGCAIASMSGSDTVTLKSAGTASLAFGILYEVSGSTCTPDVAAVSSNTTGVTACSSGSLTTATANDMLVGTCGLSTPQTPFAAGSGWSHGLNAGSSGTNLDLMGELQLAASTGSYTATSGSLSSTEQAAIEVAFQPVGTGGSCTTLADSQVGTQNQNEPLGNQASNTYGGMFFTASSTYTLCGLVLPLKKVGSPTYSQNFYIYSLVGTTPGSLVGSGSTALAASSLSSSYVNTSITGLNVPIVSGTTYWVVPVSSGAPNDNTNYVSWGATASGCGSYFAISTAGVSWSSGSACVTGIIQTYRH